MWNLERNSNLSWELIYHINRSQEIEKVYNRLLKNEGKSRKNDCHNSPTPIVILKIFPFNSIHSSQPFCKVWAKKLKNDVLALWIFQKKRGFSDFSAFLRYLGQFCQWHSIEREILHGKCIFGYFFEILGLVAPKINKRIKNEAKNNEN